MPTLLRRRLGCFYCGCRSAQVYRQGIQEWRCEHCEATNYLDENGNITDPPPHQSLPGARFAQSIPPLAHSKAIAPDESLFCSTCLQNQRFLTEALAAYFPSSNDLNHSEYEKNYPEYRKNLEDRYPQVCRTCEPRVRDRIRVAGYAAKTDHLRRMMERSRGSGKTRNYWGFKSLVLSAGEIFWYTSLAGQLLWDVVGALTSQGEDKLGEDSFLSLSACLQQFWNEFSISPLCTRKYDTAAGFALGLGLFSTWWNPRLKERLQGGGRRITGLKEYYMLYIIFLAFRIAMWWMLARPSGYEYDDRTKKAIHSFMFIFGILSFILSYRTAQIDNTPQVLFQDHIAPLVAGAPENLQHNQSHSLPPQSSTRQRSTNTNPQPFPLNELAPAALRSRSPRHNPPTPPCEDTEFEAMDWTPSQQSVPFTTKHRVPIPTQPQPSPFYGRLPPAPISQAHKLRNPPNQPIFRKASTPQKEGFFKRAHPYIEQDEVSDLCSDFDGSPATTIVQSGFASPNFAPPKFFPRTDLTKDTGLESIFLRDFSIAEEPYELRVTRGTKQSMLNTRPLNTKTRAISITLLIVSCTAWFSIWENPRLIAGLRLASLGIATAVASRGLVRSVRNYKESWRWGGILIYGSEVSCGIFLGCVIQFSSISVNTANLQTAGVVFLGGVIALECWLLVLETHSAPQTPATEPSRPSSSSVPAPPTSSIPSTSTIVATEPSGFGVNERVTRSRSKVDNHASPASRLGVLSLGGDSGRMSSEGYPGATRARKKL